MASNFVAPYNSPAQNPQSAVQKPSQPTPSVSAPSGFSSGNMLPTRPTSAPLPATAAKPAMPPGLTSGASAILRNRGTVQQPFGGLQPSAPPASNPLDRYQTPPIIAQQGGPQSYAQVMPQGQPPAITQQQATGAPPQAIQDAPPRRPVVTTPGAEAIMRSRRSAGSFQTPPHRLPVGRGEV